MAQSILFLSRWIGLGIQHLPQPRAQSVSILRVWIKIINITTTYRRLDKDAEMTKVVHSVELAMVVFQTFANLRRAGARSPSACPAGKAWHR